MQSEKNKILKDANREVIASDHFFATTADQLVLFTNKLQQ